MSTPTSDPTSVPTKDPTFDPTNDVGIHDKSSLWADNVDFIMDFNDKIWKEYV